VQSLTAPPRTAYSAAQITALLVAPDLEVDFGVERLSPTLALLEDISADVSGGTVRHDNLANTHGTIEGLTISRALAWGVDRLRPYMLLSSPSVGVSGVRFNQGVFIPTTSPDLTLGETPQSYTVTGFDQLVLLLDNVGDSYSVAAGVNVLVAVRAVLTAAGIVAPVLLDSSGSAKTLATVMTWVQSSSESATWLRICNELLAAIGYRGIWCDQDGAFCSSPYVLPADRPSEWRFDVGSLTVGMVAEARTVTSDVWGQPNRWRFVRNDLTTAPTEGAGRYTTDNTVTGPSSQAALGHIARAPVQYLDATSQADLVVQGNRIKAAAMATNEVVSAKVSPFPIAWHADRVTYADPALGVDREAQCRSWSLPLDGSDGDYVMESI
jgi:hypothetical protein